MKKGFKTLFALICALVILAGLQPQTVEATAAKAETEQAKKPNNKRLIFLSCKYFLKTAKSTILKSAFITCFFTVSFKKNIVKNIVNKDTPAAAQAGTS